MHSCVSKHGSKRRKWPAQAIILSNPKHEAHDAHTCTGVAVELSRPTD
jgi:hypothetical protein